MFLLEPKDHMPTFVVREPKNGPPIYEGDVFDHPTHTAVIVENVEIDDRAMPPERIITFRAATRQDLEDNGYI